MSDEILEISPGGPAPVGQPIKVVFGIPTYRHAVCTEFQMSALDTMDLLKKHGIEQVWNYLGGDPYVHKARDRLASYFVDSQKDYTHFMFLDDDVGWDAAGVLRLLMSPFDIACGIYPKKEGDDSGKRTYPVELAFEKSDDGSVLTPITHEGFYLAKLVPTGFMCIKRHVLEAMAADSGEYCEPDKFRGHVRCYNMFRTGFVPFEEGGKIGRWWGEDYFFTACINQLGFSAWVDPDIRLSHRGSKVWVGKFKDALDEYIKNNCGEENSKKNLTRETTGVPWTSPLTRALDAAFIEAWMGRSNLDNRVLSLEGMSGLRFRMFLNNLVAGVYTNALGASYLEIGSWQGSTAAAACWGNRVYATCIDDWSQHFFSSKGVTSGGREKFLQAMKGASENFSLVEKDFRSAEYEQLGKHNIYFYDGPHGEQDHFDAVSVALAALEDEWIFIVDDWNDEHVRNGTQRGIAEAGFDVLYSIAVRTNTVRDLADKDWYQGMYACVLKRKAVSLISSAA